MDPAACDFPLDLAHRIPIGVVRWDGAGRLVRINRVAEELFALDGTPGVTMDAWTSAAGTSCAALSDLACDQRSVVVARGRLLEVEAQALDCGDCLWLVRDASEELRLRAILAEQATYISEGTDAIFMADAAGFVLYANPVCERERGYGCGEMVGLALDRLEHIEDDERTASDRLTAIISGSGLVRYEAWHHRRDGSEFPVDVAMRPYRLGDQDVVLATARDESARMAQMQALEEARAQAEASDRAKTAFMGVASHELRTPLTAIIGFCELLLLDYGEDPALAPSLGRIHDSSRALRQLIDAIVDVSRIEGGTLKLKPGPVDVVAIARQVIANASTAARDRKLELVVEAAVAPVTIYSDHRRLTQVIASVVDNAVKHADPGPVTVRVEPGENTVRVAVIDAGPGIPSYLHESIFSAFTQGDDSSTRSSSGTGLGLYMGRGLARRLGGDLYLERTDETGSMFVIDLPRDCPETESR